MQKIIRDVKIFLSITGIDIFSAMLISTEIVDIMRFSTPWKLVSYVGLAPSIRESSGKTITGGITKQGSPWLRWILVPCELVAIKYDTHLRIFYDRKKQERPCYSHSCNCKRVACYCMVHAH